jgi:peptide chain release factor subunit 1
MAKQKFITNDIVNVRGLILAGSAEFKNVLAESNVLDPRIKDKILNVLDISYG